MSFGGYENGGDWQKQFKRTVITGGPLKGAHYHDISFEDIKKSAKSYRGDPRFNQYCKRYLSQKALQDSGEGALPTEVGPQPSRCCCLRGKFIVVAGWVWGKAKVKLGLSILLVLICLVVLTRPLFYVVLSRAIKASIKFMLRRSCGLIIVLIDAFLDEAATQLDPGLISAPSPAVVADDTAVRYELQQITGIHMLLWNSLFVLVGVLIGHRLPRAPGAVRNLRLRP